MKKFLAKLFTGIGIGLGAIIPGISGSTIAVILKVYDEIIWAINNLFKKFKLALRVLVPILIGVVLALIPSLLLMNLALNKFLFGIVCIFCGFIVGSFPNVISEVKNEKRTNKSIICAVFGFLIMILIGVGSVYLSKYIDIEDTIEAMPFWMYLLLIVVGFFASSALIVPGISGGLFLMAIGFYKPLIKFGIDWLKEFLGIGVAQSFANVGKWFSMIGCFGVGAILGFFVFSKLMGYLLSKHRVSTFYFIIGVCIASFIVMFFNNEIVDYYKVWGGATIEGVSPALPLYIEIPIGVLLLISCGFVSFYFFYLKPKKSLKSVD